MLSVATAVPRRIALIGLALTVTAVQFSIAIGEIFLAVALAGWVATLIFERRWPSAPPWMLPLMLYAGWTLASAALSPERPTSFTDCKQLILLLLVPLTYEIVDEAAAMMLTTLIITAGAVSAVIGIGQYSILHYDNLGQRPRSTLGLYMTFAGLVMLVLNVALGRVLFMTRSRIWPALVIPALAVVLPLSLSRNAWVGACCGAALLLMLRDFRLTAALPVAGAVFFAVAPAQVLQRFYSMFNLQDLTISDRFAMMRAGKQIIQAHPVFGAGPNMIERIYPQYRDPDAVLITTSHLHNVPLQIAAERGLPAVALWLWFIGAVVIGAVVLFRSARTEGPLRFLSATALASVVAMIAAGMTEHNFGDSEFQILFLVLITLPFAVARTVRLKIERPGLGGYGITVRRETAPDLPTRQ
jgi:putative inorganic carbon (HCO3(-)) transporter